MTDAAKQALIDVRIGRQSVYSGQNIQWFSTDFHYVPTKFALGQPDLVAVSVMNEHNSKNSADLVPESNVRFDVLDTEFAELERHCDGLARVDLDWVDLPQDYTITLDDTFRLEPWRSVPRFAFRSGPFIAINYHVADWVWFHVFLTDVPLEELDVGDPAQTLWRVRDLDFVSSLLFVF